MKLHLEVKEMLFSDYVTTLKKYFKRTIGAKRLCDLLFDFILDNASVDDDEKVPEEIGKDRISKMMNGKESIPQFIRDHIYDQSVIDTLNDSFQKKVVVNLVDNKEDLFYQMLQLVDRDNISPSRKASVRLLATDDTVAAFLAEVFIYAISTNTVDSIIAEQQYQDKKQAVLKLKGIVDGKISDCACVDSFSKIIGFNFDDFVDNIEKLAESIKSIKLSPMKQLEDGITAFLKGNPYTFDEKKKDNISLVCKALNIEITDDFFELGDLHSGLIPYIGRFGGISYNLEGSPESRKKLELLETLYEEINEDTKKIPFVEAFSDCYYLKLALENSGTDYDEDVRVTVRFPKNTIIKSTDVLRFDDAAVRYYLEEEYSILSIDRGEDYLCFDEAYNWNPNINLGLAFDSVPDITIDDLEHIMRFYFVSNDHYDSIEIQFDNINQYTTIAFPAIVLLRDKDIDKLKYSIRSRKSPVVLEGEINIR